MKQGLLVAMGLVLATPVAAQDTAADFREAYIRTFGERAPEAVSAAEEGLSILPTITGMWTQAHFLMEGPEFDPEVISNGCLFRPLEITTIGDFGFQTQRFRREDATGHIQTYMFATGRYFAFTTDLNGLLDGLTGGRELSEFPAEQVLGWMHSTSGFARVESVGPDVIMIDSPDASPMILVRCP